jgi:hypothetical protein
MECPTNISPGAISQITEEGGGGGRGATSLQYSASYCAGQLALQSVSPWLSAILLAAPPLRGNDAGDSAE